MKRIFMFIMVLVIMLISIGGCIWWDFDDGHGRHGRRGGGQSRGGGEGRGGGDHGGRQ